MNEGENTQEESDIMCTICQEGEFSFMGRIDSCNHIYCYSCINTWSKQSSICPACKKRFKYLSKVPVGSEKAAKTKKVKERDLVLGEEYDPIFEDFEFDEEDEEALFYAWESESDDDPDFEEGASMRPVRQRRVLRRRGRPVAQSNHRDSEDSPGFTTDSLSSSSPEDTSQEEDNVSMGSENEPIAQLLRSNRATTEGTTATATTSGTLPHNRQQRGTYVRRQATRRRRGHTVTTTTTSTTTTTTTTVQLHKDPSLEPSIGLLPEDQQLNNDDEQEEEEEALPRSYSEHYSPSSSPLRSAPTSFHPKLLDDDQTTVASSRTRRSNAGTRGEEKGIVFPILEDDDGTSSMCTTTTPVKATVRIVDDDITTCNTSVAPYNKLGGTTTTSTGVGVHRKVVEDDNSTIATTSTYGATKVIDDDRSTIYTQLSSPPRTPTRTITTTQQHQQQGESSHTRRRVAAVVSPDTKTVPMLSAQEHNRKKQHLQQQIQYSKTKMNSARKPASGKQNQQSAKDNINIQLEAARRIIKETKRQQQEEREAKVVARGGGEEEGRRHTYNNRTHHHHSSNNSGKTRVKYSDRIRNDQPVPSQEKRLAFKSFEHRANYHFGSSQLSPDSAKLAGTSDLDRPCANRRGAANQFGRNHNTTSTSNGGTKAPHAACGSAPVPFKPIGEYSKLLCKAQKAIKPALNWNPTKGVRKTQTTTSSSTHKSSTTHIIGKPEVEISNHKPPTTICDPLPPPPPPFQPLREPCKRAGFSSIGTPLTIRSKKRIREEPSSTEGSELPLKRSKYTSSSSNCMMQEDTTTALSDQSVPPTPRAVGCGSGDNTSCLSFKAYKSLKKETEVFRPPSRVNHKPQKLRADQPTSEKHKETRRLNSKVCEYVHKELHKPYSAKLITKEQYKLVCKDLCDRLQKMQVSSLPKKDIVEFIRKMAEHGVAQLAKCTHEHKM